MPGSWSDCVLARSGVGKALLGKFPVIWSGRNAIEKTVARNTGHSFELFDYLPKSILDFGKLFWIFNIICNVWSYQLTVLDFNNHLSAFCYADP